jgi:hypothetical protein
VHLGRVVSLTRLTTLHFVFFSNFSWALKTLFAFEAVIIAAFW